MNKTTSILAAAVTGLFLGSTMGCKEEGKTGTPAENKSTTKGASAAALAVSEKHACKGMNSCANKGGCSTGDKGCAAKNTCSAKGGCATVEHHSCAKKNACRSQGGCKTGDAGCASKNTCSAKGGCAVPVKH